MVKFGAAIKVLFCQECQFTCKRKKIMERHRTGHTGNPNNKTMPSGNYSIEDSYELQKMAIALIDEEQDYSCEKIH